MLLLLRLKLLTLGKQVDQLEIQGHLADLTESDIRPREEAEVG